MTFKHLREWSLKIRNLKHVQFSRHISNSKQSGDQNFLNYSAEQQLTVINTLHKCVQNNETRTHLNEKRLQSLKPLFKENPNLKSLEPLLHISGFGPKLIHKICDNILQDSSSELKINEETVQDNNKKTQKIRLPSGLLTPAFIFQVGVKTVVSIKLGISSISWSRLRINDSQLDSWDLIDITEWADKKYDVHSVYDLVMKLREDIPDGDLYILENSNWSNVTNVKKPMKYHIQEAMLTTAICSIFNLADSNRESRAEETNRVYFLRSYTPFRLFSKVVGSERVSAEDLVLNMIAGQPDDRFKPVNFINGTAERFLNFNGSKRDSMCQSLLLVISFTELILYKNMIGLNIISLPLNKKKR